MKKRIEICGGIASGKTSLAKILENEGYSAVYERFEDNPFLNKFYTDAEDNNVLETEIVFTLLHYNCIKRSNNKAKIVCDYSLFQDYCYALNNLNGDERIVFKKLYKYLVSQISPVDLLIYLKCDVDCLIQRIKERDRKMEQSISREYLQSNIDTIEKYLVEKDNVLIIQSDKYNFIERDKGVVLEMIRNVVK